MLVVQHRGVLVVRDDIVVRHLLFTLRAGLEILHMRLVFGRPAAKRGECGQMAARAQLVRTAHAFELIRGLHGAVVMQAHQQFRRIDRRGLIRGEAVDGADACDTPELRPVLARPGRVGQRCDVDGCRPRFTRQACRLVPVVVGLVKQHSRPRAGRVNDHALRIVDDGRPRFEVRVHFIWVCLIVEELGRRTTCVDHQCLKTGRGERGVRAPHLRAQVLRIKIIQTDFAQVDSSVCLGPK